MKKGFTQVENEILYNDKLSLKAKGIYMIIKSYCICSEECFISIPKICEAAKISRPSAIKYINELIDTGILIKENNSGKNNAYKIKKNDVIKIKKGFTKIENEILHDNKLSLEARGIFILIKSYCIASEECFPSVPTICEVANISRPSADKYIKELTTSGTLTKENRLGTSNIYKIKKDVAIPSTKNTTSHKRNSQIEVQDHNNTEKEKCQIISLEKIEKIIDDIFLYPEDLDPDEDVVRYFQEIFYKDKEFYKKLFLDRYIKRTEDKKIAKPAKYCKSMIINFIKQNW